MGSRGVANVVGIVLLLGFVVVGAAGIFVVGSMAVGSVQSDADVEQAQTSMVTFADSVSNGQSASFSAPNSGTTRLVNESRITVDVGSTNLLNTSMGTIIYEHDGRQRVFEGGAVFAASDETASIVRPPTISYQYDPNAGHQTLVVDAVQVRGSVDDLEAGSAMEREGVRLAQDNNVVDDQVTVTITSQYDEAWAQYFRDRTRANVTVDGTTNTVTATFPVWNPTTVDSSFSVDGSLSLGGNIGVDSYDSRTPQGAGSIGIGNYEETDGGDVIATEGFGGWGSMHVDGDLYVNDSFAYGGGTSVDGNVYATGDVSIDNNQVNDTIVSGGDVTVTGSGVTFTEHGEIRAAGRFDDPNSNTYAGRIHAGEQLVADGSWSTIEASAEFVAGDTVSVHPSPDPSQVTEHAAGPSTEELSKIQEAIDSMPDPSERVQTAFDHYGSAPNPGIGGNNANDHLTAGTYRIDGDLDYSGSPSLTVDTSGGDVVLLVDGDVNAQNLDAEVVGDGSVHIYITGNFETGGGAEWTNPDGAGNRLFIYTAAPSATTSIQGPFYGVVFSESDLSLGGGTNVYGGVVMDGTSISGGQNVYFDEALSQVDIAIEEDSSTDVRRTYLHVSHTTVDGE